MAENDDAFRVDGILARELLQKLISGGDVLEAAGPASAGIAYAAVLEVPGRESRFGESGAQESGVNWVSSLP
jgi:hypothetical protein